MELWWNSATLGLVSGIVVGYLWWRLPAHVQMVRDRRGRRVRTEVDRIRGGFNERFYIPNKPPPPFLRMRILKYCQQWWAETTPRKPEEVALLAQIKEIDDHQQDSERRGMVLRPRQAALRQPQRSPTRHQPSSRRAQESVRV